MPNSRLLDDDEMALLAAFEAGQLQSLRAPGERERLQAAARATRIAWENGDRPADAGSVHAPEQPGA